MARDDARRNVANCDDARQASKAQRVLLSGDHRSVTDEIARRHREMVARET
jgi:hypothetical protein